MMAVCLFCATSCQGDDDNPRGVVQKWFSGSGNNTIVTNCKSDDNMGLLLRSEEGEIKVEPAQSCHQEEEEEEEEEEVVFNTESGKDGNLLLQGHLWAIFICRQVLQLSVEQVADYLSRNGGSLNPDGWFSVCSSCDAAVRDCFTLQRSIRQLERKLEGVKRRLVNLIYSTGDEEHAEQEGRKRRRPCQEKNLTFDIRETILKDLYATHDDDFGATTKVKISPHRRRRRVRAIRKKCTVKVGGGGRGGAESQQRHNNKSQEDPYSVTATPLYSDFEEDDDAAAAGSESDSSGSDCWSPSEPDSADEEERLKIKTTNKPPKCRNPVSPTTPPNKTKIIRDVAPDEDDTLKPEEKEMSPNLPLPPRRKRNQQFRVKRKYTFSANAIPYYCDHCPLIFSQKSRFLGHCRKFHSERPLVPCQLCTTSGSVEFVSTQLLKLHVETAHHSAEVKLEDDVTEAPPSHSPPPPAAPAVVEGDCKPSICPHCPETFPSQGKLDLHIAKVHRESLLTCKRCKFKTLKYARYMAHLDVHKRRDLRRAKRGANTKGIPFYCDHCHMIYAHKAWLVTHVRGFHSSAQSPSCPYCPSKFVSKQLLRLHVEGVHPDEEIEKAPDDGTGPPPPEDDSEPNKSCPHCPETFPSKLKLDLHIATLHRDALLTCKTCQYKAETYSIFVDHSRTHQDPETREKAFACHLCGLGVGCKKALRYHLGAHHSEALGLEDIVCPICGAKFRSSSILKTHIKHVHEKSKEHFCEFCGKAFGRAHDLKKHLLLHTAPASSSSSSPQKLQSKKRPSSSSSSSSFNCQYCQAQFNVRQGLFYHLKREHSDKYAFRCEQCGLGYSSKATLTHHQQRGEESSCQGSSTLRKVHAKKKKQRFAYIKV